MSHALFHPSGIDYIIVVAYFVFVIAVGFLLRRQTVTGEDFFLSGRSLPAWITGIAFMSANLGSTEIIGMSAGGAEYGMTQTHFYWIGAIPAMVFMGLYMMPFYYASRARSVPEYLKLRFNEATRGVNAAAFAVMTILVSGIGLYSMAILFQTLVGWSLNTSIWVSAAIVLVYVFLGGLTSSIFNEVTQFFLIVLGLLPVTLIGMHNLGGWNGIVQRVPSDFAHVWAGLGTAHNSLGANWVAVVLGLGFVTSFAYWTTDFLVVQRTFAANSMRAAQVTPIYASFIKMFIPFISVVVGLIALAVFPHIGHDGTSYNLAFPLLMAKYYPVGMIGLGITAMMASFMSGQAGNITAFSTVWTYDIYQAYFKKDASDAHYLWMGRMATVVGVLISIATSYIAAGFPSIMDYMQTLFSFFNAPIFGVFLLGMFWKRATGWGAFWGLVSGIAFAFIFYFFLPFHFATPNAGNFWRAWWVWVVTTVVCVLVSLITKPKSEEELKGLVYGVTKYRSYKGYPWYKRPGVLGCISLAMFIVLDIIFW
ncbi:MAG: sodium:solute symporter family protein [Alicyclobacillus herbarius]|uniref:sodium:solute symporter family protein n=1 Tax=Alicyclobacillus herbarius TaxID=122960 RepID=UPI002352DB64|nr:sodium:solute symporter family protein [Alicyclobacillus herbarius]MCL6631911.1 sodium:solute symporter family protein [Alicyclobacillus herbarius]